MHTLIVHAAIVCQLRITPFTWTDVLALAGIAALICGLRSLFVQTERVDPSGTAIDHDNVAMSARRTSIAHPSRTATTPVPRILSRGLGVSSATGDPPMQRKDLTRQGVAGAQRGRSAIGAVALVSLLALCIAALLRTTRRQPLRPAARHRA